MSGSTIVARASFDAFHADIVFEGLHTYGNHLEVFTQSSDFESWNIVQIDLEWLGVGDLGGHAISTSTPLPTLIPFNTNPIVIRTDTEGEDIPATGVLGKVYVRKISTNSIYSNDLDITSNGSSVIAKADFSTTLAVAIEVNGFHVAGAQCSLYGFNYSSGALDDVELVAIDLNWDESG